jgi:hypothetical protein
MAELRLTETQYWNTQFALLGAARFKADIRNFQ